MSSMELNKQQKEFFDYFEKMAGVRPTGMDLVSLTGSNSLMKKIGLELPVFQKEFWGLLVFCGEKLFYYIHPTEYSYMGLVKQGERELAVKEQLLCFNDYVHFSAELPHHPKLLSFFFNSHLLQLTFSVKNGEGSENVYLNMQTLQKASVMYEKLKPYFH